MDGIPTNTGYQVSDKFLQDFANACCMALDYFDQQPVYYQEVSKIISNHVVENMTGERLHLYGNLWLTI